MSSPKKFKKPTLRSLNFLASYRSSSRTMKTKRMKSQDSLSKWKSDYALNPKVYIKIKPQSTESIRISESYPTRYFWKQRRRYWRTAMDLLRILNWFRGQSSFKFIVSKRWYFFECALAGVFLGFCLQTLKNESLSCSYFLIKVTFVGFFSYLIFAECGDQRWGLRSLRFCLFFKRGKLLPEVKGINWDFLGCFIGGFLALFTENKPWGAVLEFFALQLLVGLGSAKVWLFFNFLILSAFLHNKKAFLILDNMESLARVEENPWAQIRQNKLNQGEPLTK